jgi:hypothetical protein
LGDSRSDNSIGSDHSERLGDTKVVTAEHYLFALGDHTEVDYTAALDP